MHYVYLLKSRKNGKAYIGQTDNLQRRFYQHNHGQSIATKPYAPYDLIYYEAYQSKALAEERERKLKAHGKGLSELKKRTAFDDS